jgi:hypothetical protein
MVDKRWFGELKKWAATKIYINIHKFPQNNIISILET